MSCDLCTDGFVPFVPKDHLKPVADTTAADLYFAVCLCPTGQVWRNRENNGRKVAPLWAVWCARNQVDYRRVVMLESVYTASELAEAGLGHPEEQNRATALLARGRGKR